MCGRYTLFNTSSLKKRFNLATKIDKLRANYNVAPGQFMPVVIDLDGKREIEIMKWGLVPVWAKDISIGYKLINARAETVFDKPMWKGSVMHHRCLVPSNGFYEWKATNEKTKQPYFIKPKDQELFSFAGVFSAWKDAEGKELFTFSIITTEPNKEMENIHNRMPAILHPEDEDKWLKPSSETRDDIEPLLRPLEDGSLEMYAVSRDVNSPKNNEESLIYHLDD